VLEAGTGYRLLRCNVCTDNNSCVDKAELLHLVKTVVYASDQGVFISQNMSSSQWEDDWALAHSIYFMATTLTTIGLSAFLWLRG